jgi:hypothetical protein
MWPKTEWLPSVHGKQKQTFVVSSSEKQGQPATITESIRICG